MKKIGFFVRLCILVGLTVGACTSTPSPTTESFGLVDVATSTSEGTQTPQPIESGAEPIFPTSPAVVANAQPTAVTTATEPVSQPTPPVEDTQVAPTIAPAPQPTAVPNTPTAPRGTFCFGVVGDFGSPGNPAETVAKMVKSWNCAAVVTVGDNNYPTGAAQDFAANTDAHYDWAYPYFDPALGNHDWGYPDANSFAPNKIPQLKHFSYLPQSPANGRYYTISLDGGIVQIYVLDSDRREPDGRTADSIQGQWLQTAMATSTAPIKLIFLHEPPYSSCEPPRGDTPTMQWPFKEWAGTAFVAVLAGHCHSYERLSVDGLTYIVDGAGGGGGVNGFGTPRTGSMFRSTDRGAVKITIANGTITFQFFSVSAGKKAIDTYSVNY